MKLSILPLAFLISLGVLFSGRPLMGQTYNSKADLSALEWLDSADCLIKRRSYLKL